LRPLGVEGCESRYTRAQKLGNQRWSGVKESSKKPITHDSKGTSMTRYALCGWGYRHMVMLRLHRGGYDRHDEGSTAR
jgi:hypothetical protein